MIRWRGDVDISGGTWIVASAVALRRRIGAPRDGRRRRFGDPLLVIAAFIWAVTIVHLDRQLSGRTGAEPLSRQPTVRIGCASRHRRLPVVGAVRVAPPLGRRRAGVARDVAVRLHDVGCRAARRRPLRARRRRPDHGRAAGPVRVAARRHGATRRPRHCGRCCRRSGRMSPARTPQQALLMSLVMAHGDVVRLWR